MIGLSAAVYCCFQLSLCLAGHLTSSVGRKISVDVFYSKFTNFFYFYHVFTHLTFFYFLEERFFIYAIPPNLQTSS